MSTHHELLLKQRNAELEQRLAEKITELQEKNRELEIETALERVRARTMAMQNSEELPGVSSELYHQLNELGEPADQLTIGVVKEEGNIMEMSATLQGKILQQQYRHSIDEPIVMKKLFTAWKAGQRSLIIDIGGKELEQYNRYRNELTASNMFPVRITDERSILYIAFYSKGTLALATSQPRPEGSLQLLERFAKVFEQTYTRFLDLQKAEAQAKEAQIEAALERVRSRSLAMHKSDELTVIARTMFEQLRGLGLELEDGLIIMLFREDSREQLQWPVLEGLEMDTMFVVPYFDHPVMNEVYKAREAGVKFIERHFGKAIKDDFLEKIFSITDYKVIPVEFQKKNFAGSCYHYSFAMEKFTGILMHSYNRESYPAAYNDIIRRFTRVFEQAYIRFLDLQRAEAQAREAEIQLAVERVRARAMAMRHSEELNDVLSVLFKQYDMLGIKPNHAALTLYDFENRKMIRRVTGRYGKRVLAQVVIDMNAMPNWKENLEAWKNNNQYTISVSEFPVADIPMIFKIIAPLIDSMPEDAKIKQEDFPNGGWAVDVNCKFGSIGFVHDRPPKEEEKDILVRLAKEFDQLYQRFLDFKKAEAQAREAEIELALERVRAKTMAMQNSDDVTTATSVMFSELHKLGIETMRCGVLIIDEHQVMEVWTTTTSKDGHVMRVAGKLDMKIHPLLRGVYRAWKEKEEMFTYHLQGADMKSYYRFLAESPEFSMPPQDPDMNEHYCSVFFFEEGGLYTFCPDQHSDDTKSVLKKFTSVFSLTFRRYRDLKKAESQAREATIEAALEKVRGKAMAMHNSNDLSVTASMVFTELRKLGINPIRCGVGLLNKESRRAQLYSAASSPDGDSLSLVGWVILSQHPVLEKIYATWVSHEEYYPELQGEEMRSYYQLLLKGLPGAVPDIETGKKQYGHFLPFSVGCLYAWADTAYDEAEIKILRRFASIIDLTFRRYIELHQSEANAREAVKQAALDRIRADIASMRTVNDLDRITPLIWNELTILGLPFIRCGVFIMDSAHRLIHTFLSTPDGKAIAAFHMPYHTPGNFAVMVNHWESKKMYISRWTEDDFVDIAEILLKQREIATKEQYLGSLPKGGFYLHFLPFLQGMLYVGNTNKLTEEQTELIQHVANAFSTAYARYEDFNKLEAAKQQVERTLVDLKQAQQQLIQSEKMASLGELTAGIAHEIQNPLNFVNNFSEVNGELIEELQAERSKPKSERDDMLEDEIINDLKQNLEKINHHGKRADAIVKGMLQHSRTSSGQKDLTDINALCDEYLRLAYHGLRAKDKSFNADFKTEFDETIGKIDVIPQDIGRVLLNLYNNAFYAVNERRKVESEGYKAMVLVQTKRIALLQGMKAKMQIKVCDNGNGILKGIVDKIFQPFFTTKPTGQGTGLGLSLAYDIIKTHGGEIKVETKAGDGSEFIIQLPIS